VWRKACALRLALSCFYPLLDKPHNACNGPLSTLIILQASCLVFCLSYVNSKMAVPLCNLPSRKRSTPDSQGKHTTLLGGMGNEVLRYALDRIYQLAQKGEVFWCQFLDQFLNHQTIAIFCLETIFPFFFPGKYPGIASPIQACTFLFAVREIVGFWKSSWGCPRTDVCIMTEFKTRASGGCVLPHREQEKACSLIHATVISVQEKGVPSLCQACRE